LGAPFLVIGLLQPKNVDPAELTFQYVVFIFVLLLLAYWPVVVARTLKVRSSVIYVWLSLVLSGYVGLAVISSREMRTGAPPSEEVAFVAAILAIIVLTTALYAYPLIVVWSSISLQRAWSVEYPESRVVRTLIMILGVLEDTRHDEEVGHDDGQDPRPLYITGRLWSSLDQGVEAVQQGLPRLLNPHNTNDPAVQSSTAQIAAGLRQLRAATVLPGGAARAEDIQRVRDALRTWVVGTLDDLPKAEPEPEVDSARQRSSLRRSNQLRRILVAVAPLALLLVIVLLPFSLTTVEEALAPFAIAWLISAGLSALDPEGIAADRFTSLWPRSGA
jgi:hypothetical protein